MAPRLKSNTVAEQPDAARAAAGVSKDTAAGAAIATMSFDTRSALCADRCSEPVNLWFLH